MGGITTPVLATLGAVNKVERAVKGTKSLLGGGGSKARRRERAQLAAEQAAETADLTARQEADRTDLQQRNAREAARIQAESEIAEARRKRLARQETGSLRAQLGAQGISSADGSGEALILGRLNAAEEERKGAARLDALKRAALSDEEEALSRRNLLDLTKQQEKQRLERLARGV